MTDVLKMGICDGCHLCPVLIFYLLSWEQVAGSNSKDACMSFAELQPQEDVLLSSPVSCLGHCSGRAIRCCHCRPGEKTNLALPVTHANVVCLALLSMPRGTREERGWKEHEISPFWSSEL